MELQSIILKRYWIAALHSDCSENNPRKFNLNSMKRAAVNNYKDIRIKFDILLNGAFEYSF